MFTKNTIKSRVLKVVNSRIQEAENQLVANCREIDENLSKKITELKAKSEEDKEQLADDLVKGILGKVIL